MPCDEKEKYEKMLKLGEIYLQTQLQLAIASDQRAIALGTSFMVVGVSLLIATIALWTEIKDIPTLITGVVGVLLLFAYSVICFWVAKPMKIRSSGNDPDSWLDYIEDDLKEMLKSQAKIYSQCIKENNLKLEKRAKIMNKIIKSIIFYLLLLAFIWFILFFTIK